MQQQQQQQQPPENGGKRRDNSTSNAAVPPAPSSPGVRAVGLALAPGDLWGLAAAGEAAGRLEAECHDTLSRMGAFLSVVSGGGGARLVRPPLVVAASSASCIGTKGGLSRTWPFLSVMSGAGTADGVYRYLPCWEHARDKELHWIGGSLSWRTICAGVPSVVQLMPYTQDEIEFSRRVMLPGGDAAPAAGASPASVCVVARRVAARQRGVARVSCADTTSGGRLCGLGRYGSAWQYRAVPGLEL